MVAEASFGLQYEGPPGYLHGGMSGLLMDQMLGTAAIAAGRWGMTAHLELDYRGPVPLDTPVVLRAWVAQEHGRRTTMAGSIAPAAEPERVLVEVTGVFVTPREDALADLLRRGGRRLRAAPPAAPGHRRHRAGRRTHRDRRRAVRPGPPARSAGQVLLALREELAEADPAERKAEGDRRSQRATSPPSSPLPRPQDDRVLSEEAVDDTAPPLTADRVWIVDPLDGTREFSEPGRALRLGGARGAVGARGRGRGRRPDGGRGRAAGAGARCSPPTRRRSCRRCLPGRCGWRCPGPAHRRSPGPPRLALGAVLVPLGSAGYKAMAVVRGEADAYVHAGGMHQWDSAAPVAVARAAGLFTARLDGSPLVYNGADTWLPDLVVCRPELADRVLSAVHSPLTAPPAAADQPLHQADQQRHPEEPAPRPRGYPGTQRGPERGVQARG